MLSYTYLMIDYCLEHHLITQDDKEYLERCAELQAQAMYLGGLAGDPNMIWVEFGNGRAHAIHTSAGFLAEVIGYLVCRVKHPTARLSFCGAKADQVAGTTDLMCDDKRIQIKAVILSNTGVNTYAPFGKIVSDEILFVDISKNKVWIVPTDAFISWFKSTAPIQIKNNLGKTEDVWVLNHRQLHSLSHTRHSTKGWYLNDNWNRGVIVG
jgi:hypothetical protein